MGTSFLSGKKTSVLPWIWRWTVRRGWRLKPENLVIYGPLQSTIFSTHTNICIYTYIYIYKHIHTYIYTYLCIYVFMIICIYIYLYVSLSSKRIVSKLGIPGIPSGSLRYSNMATGTKPRNGHWNWNIIKLINYVDSPCFIIIGA